MVFAPAIHEENCEDFFAGPAVSAGHPKPVHDPETRTTSRKFLPLCQQKVDLFHQPLEVIVHTPAEPPFVLHPTVPAVRGKRARAQRHAEDLGSSGLFSVCDRYRFSTRPRGSSTR